LRSALAAVSLLPIACVADAFSPRQQVTKTPDQLNPFTINLWDYIKRLGSTFKRSRRSMGGW